MWWTESLGRIELNITKAQAASCAHMGFCDADIAILRTVPAIRRQLNKLDPDLVRDALKEYGAWNLTEMSDHDANLSRLLWIACCDITEGR
jgi:hypothetical protein